MESPIINSPRELALFLLEQTNFHEAPVGTVVVVDINAETHEVTQIGHTRPDADPNEMLGHFDENLKDTDGRVLVVPLDWNTNPFIKDQMSIIQNHPQGLDVLAIDPDRKVFWSVLCSEPECCPPDGQAIYTIGLS